MTNSSKFLNGIQNIAARVEAAATTTSKQIRQATQHAYMSATPIINDTTQHTGTVAGNAYAATAEMASDAVDYLKEHAGTLGSDVANVVSLDDIGRRIASLGTPAIVFAIAASIAGGMGLAGGAVVTTALAMLGGPFGMIGGLMVLGTLTVIADAVGKYGIEAVLAATLRARHEQGMTDEQIFQEIDALWISDELKWKIKHHLKQASE